MDPQPNPKRGTGGPRGPLFQRGAGGSGKPGNRPDGPPARFSLFYYLGLFALIMLLQGIFFSEPPGKPIAYSEFLDKIAAGEIEKVAITESRIYGLFKDPNAKSSEKPVDVDSDGLEVEGGKTPWRIDPLAWFRSAEEGVKDLQQARAERAARQFSVQRVDDPTLVALLHEHRIEFYSKVESRFFRDLLANWIVPIGIMVLLWMFLMRRMGASGPGAALQMGRSKAKIYQADPDTLVHFDDVAGVDEAVEETREIVAFLQNPEKFTRLGAKLPKGVLLVGPPGTGKTLLAKAIAGESGVPFFSLSGSDFVEMFVGVGAARVRDLFAAAKEKAPCIVFIDELDAIGKSRAGQGPMVGGYDERENTLNQILVEMDGFSGTTGVVLIGATNRPEILDRALLRPGRFDRQILVGRPHKDGRVAIFRVHTQSLPLAADVELERLAAQTAGMVGADIANLCNEAALLASRRGVDQVEMSDFQDAFERIIGGLEKKGQVMSEKDRRTVAFHESGHAIVGWFTPGADAVRKVSIVPRGQGALGYTLQSPEEDRYLMSREELLGRVRMLMGGRAAEELVFGEVSTGASDDLEKASRIVGDMLNVYGMSRTAPNLSLVSQSGPDFLGQGLAISKPSDELERRLYEERIALLAECYDAARKLLEAKRDRLEALAARLLDREKIDTGDLVEILGPRPEATTGAHPE